MVYKIIVIIKYDRHGGMEVDDALLPVITNSLCGRGSHWIPFTKRRKAGRIILFITMMLSPHTMPTLVKTIYIIIIIFGLDVQHIWYFGSYQLMKRSLSNMKGQ